MKSLFCHETNHSFDLEALRKSRLPHTHRRPYRIRLARGRSTMRLVTTASAPRVPITAKAQRAPQCGQGTNEHASHCDHDPVHEKYRHGPEIHSESRIRTTGPERGVGVHMADR